jgi:WD40 repeat protein
LLIWDTTTEKIVQAFRGHTEDVESVAWGPEDKWIVSGSSDRTMRIWDVETGQPLRIFEGHSINSVSVDPAGNKIASAGDDNTLRFWWAGSNVSQVIETYGTYPSSVTWNPEGTRIASGQWHNRVRIWDAATGNCLRVLGTDHDSSSTQHVSSVAWSAQGRRIASGDNKGLVRIWDAETGECSQTLKSNGSALHTVAWNPDGTQVASGSDGLEDNLHVWNLATGEIQWNLEGHEGVVTSLAWSPDGTRIVSGSYDGSLRIWDAQSGKCLETLEGEKAVHCVGWDPQGRRIVSGAEDNSVRIWDSTTGECLHVMEGHEESLRAVAWSPDGERIVSGCREGALRVWRATTGECLLTLHGHARGSVSYVNSVAWNPQGTRIASASQDKTIRIWESRLDEALPFWRSEAPRQRVRAHVDALFDEHFLLEPVLEELREDPDLRPELRAAALLYAEGRGMRTAQEVSVRGYHLASGKLPDKSIDLALALRLTRVAVECKPKGPECRSRLAWVLFYNGLHDEALAESEKAFTLAKEEAEALPGIPWSSGDLNNSPLWISNSLIAEIAKGEDLNSLRTKIEQARTPAPSPDDGR